MLGRVGAHITTDKKQDRGHDVGQHTRVRGDPGLCRPVQGQVAEQGAEGKKGAECFWTGGVVCLATVQWTESRAGNLLV